jgi:hypothetical protein
VASASFHARYEYGGPWAGADSAVPK